MSSGREFIDTRRCSQCKEVKPTQDFSPRKNRKRGYYSLCKECVNESQNSRKLEKGITSKRYPMSNKSFDNLIRGPRPKAGEKAIYFLRNSDGVAFYVGMTKNPKNRLSEHRLVFQNPNIQMAIVKVVPEFEAAYWESKLLTDFIEAGLPIVNVRTAQ